MLQYTKAYGVYQAVEEIINFMKQQKGIVERANQQKNETYE
jgi:hypothetical protein